MKKTLISFSLFFFPLLTFSAAPTFIWEAYNDPKLVPPGPGAGVWNSEPPSKENILLAKSAKTYLKSQDAKKQYGEEASGSFHHYFENNGQDYIISIEKMLHEVNSARTNFDTLIDALRSEALTFKEGNHSFTLKEALLGNVESQENKNWYLAVAGYSYWITGAIEVTEHQVMATVQLKLWDRYDWDPGVTIPIATPIGTIPVDQERVGEFHRQGLAKEFDTRGVLVRKFTWQK